MEGNEKRLWMAAELLIYGKEKTAKEMKEILECGITGQENKALDSYIQVALSPDTPFGYTDEYVENEMKKYKLKDYLTIFSSMLSDKKTIDVGWCVVDTFFGLRPAIHKILCSSYGCGSCKNNTTIYAMYNTIKEKSKDAKDAEIFKRYFLCFLKSKELLNTSMNTILGEIVGKPVEEQKDKSYQIGDTVTIKEDLIGGQSYDGLLFNKEMEKYKGSAFKIQEIREVNGKQFLSLEGMTPWVWLASWVQYA